jgi:hypothetical protein
MMEAIFSSETSVIIYVTWRHIPQDGTLHSTLLCDNVARDIFIISFILCGDLTHYVIQAGHYMERQIGK